MSFRGFLKRCLMEFFIITTCVTAAIAILGQRIDPTARFGYEAFYSPLLFGFMSMIPSLVTYTSKELSLRKTLLRKLLHFTLLEVILIAFGHQAGILSGVSDTLSFALTVLAVYLAVNYASWHLASKEAGKINEKLKSLQRRS